MRYLKPQHYWAAAVESQVVLSWTAMYNLDQILNHNWISFNHIAAVGFDLYEIENEVLGQYNSFHLP